MTAGRTCSTDFSPTSLITVDVTFAGRDVRLFFTKRDKWGKWNGLITTNRKLDFFEAYRIYSRRWSLEVVFKESIN